MPRYILGSPNGWLGSIIETDDDENAIQMAKELFGEKVLDITETEDPENDRQMIWLLVVADEEPS
jgi:hypothetical protein